MTNATLGLTLSKVGTADPTQLPPTAQPLAKPDHPSFVVPRPSSSLPYWSLPIFPDRLGAVGFYHLGDLGGGAVIVDLELFSCVCPA